MTIPEGINLLQNGDPKYPSTSTAPEYNINSVQEGKKLILITFRWWKKYLGQEILINDISKPGPVYCSCTVQASCINNNDLTIHLKRESEIELGEPLLDSNDHVVLPEEHFEDFKKWYNSGYYGAIKSTSNGLPPDSTSVAESHCFPVHLEFVMGGMEIMLSIKKLDTGEEKYQKACELLDLGSEQIRIWDYFGMLAVDPDKICSKVFLELWLDKSFPAENGSAVNETIDLVTLEPSRSSFSIAGGPTVSGHISKDLVSDNVHSNPIVNSERSVGFPSSSNARTSSGGLTGLQNLGNTCFMNSALQCLVHTPQLVDFFLKDYRQEINSQNPLGMEGELAIEFGELLRKLWAPDRQPVAPRTFKTKLARFAPQFSGYNQHDSQELLAFLLDGLHEDLNRVKLKPYIQSKDANGRPDNEVAQEYWENHKARNDSIIVDICQGQYKSTLVCPICNKISVTFDPFMYLSLPLPLTTTRTLTVNVFTSNGTAPPIPYTVSISKQGKCKDLVEAISRACELRDNEKLILTEPHHLRNVRVYEDSVDLLSPIRDDEQITAHRLTKKSERSPLVIFVNRRLEEDSILRKPAKCFGSPLVAYVTDENLQNGSDLFSLFETLIRPLLKTENYIRNGTDIDHDQEKEVASSDPSNATVMDSTNKNNISSISRMFKFWLTEDRIVPQETVIEGDKPLPSPFKTSTSRRIQVGVDWSEDAMEKYNVKHLDFLSSSRAPKPRQEVVNLYSCLEAFLKEEPLGPEDMWYCPQCKDHRQATKKLDLWRLPDILVVHLKRFSYSRYLKNKLEAYVNFPIHDLDLRKYIPGNDAATYELYAISNHYGSMGGGHYTAYAKLLSDDRWYNFDDSHVSPVGENEIKTSAAYVLFYQRTKKQKPEGSLSNGQSS